MTWFLRFKERLALRVLLQSKNITMLAWKDASNPQIWITADPRDVGAYQFFVYNNTDKGPSPEDLDSMMLERLFHSPDAKKP